MKRSRPYEKAAAIEDLSKLRFHGTSPHNFQTPKRVGVGSESILSVNWKG